MTNIEKTKQLLRSYTGLKSKLSKYTETLGYLQNHGTTGLNMSMNHFGIEKVKGGNTEYKSSLEKQQDKIESIEKAINEIEYKLKYIELGFNLIEYDKHYEVFKLRYLENKTIDFIAEKLEISDSTVKRNLRRLIKELNFFYFEI